MTAPEQQTEHPHPEIRAVLQATAREFEPDRTAMINRVAANRGSRRAWFLLRPVGAAAAVVVISTLSVVAVRAAVTVPPVAPIPAAPSASAPAPAASRAGTATDQHPIRPAAPRFVSATGVVDPHSVATWSQSNVTITSSKPIDALLLTITVAATPGLAEAGKYTSAPNNDFSITVVKGQKTVRYAYALRPGRKLAPGSYLFAAQFQHRSGRSAAADAYAVTARTGSAGADLSGTFS